MLLPWTTESGFGAVAFDGSMWVNRDDVRRFGLSEVDVERAAAEARDKVERRLAKLRGARSTFALKGRTVIDYCVPFSNTALFLCA